MPLNVVLIPDHVRVLMQPRQVLFPPRDGGKDRWAADEPEFLLHRTQASHLGRTIAVGQMSAERKQPSHMGGASGPL